MSKKIFRITLFKIASDADIEAVLPKYAALKETATKDGNQYIIMAKASRTYNDPRNKGFNFGARTVFASLEDMKYYDETCDAHKEIKATLKGKVEDIMTVYMDSDA
ncbi:hypothetical protein AOQ84DRAFT_208966 [Glonium stellatum]|uniref:Stress-response A/B barrel domain-containing protein n=1 Tax=Glonium stellatum TaxID=574774 RepID=A0A8E2F557_9PEZI|nr:hypothetical protein AOQ84DRAFT_208966 [Glonium stellatum]